MTLTCQGTSWNQSETIGTFTEPVGTPKSAKIRKRVIFIENGTLSKLFLRLCERLKVFYASHMSGYLTKQYDTMMTSKEPSGT